MGVMKGNSIAENIFHLFYSTIFASVLNAATLIVLASYLNSYNYGLFSVVLAFAMILGYCTDVGLSRIVVRECADKDSDIPAIFTSYLKLRLGLLVISLAVAFVLLHVFYTQNQELITTAYYLVIPMVTGLMLQSIGTVYFQVKEKMQYSGLIRITSAGLLVTSVFTGMLLSLEPVIICGLYGGSYFIAGLLALFMVSRSMRFEYKSRFHKGLYKEMGPFTIDGLLFVMIPQLGPIILEQTLALTAVGFFAVAYRIPQALQQIPFVVAGAYYPVMYRNFQHNNIQEHTRLNIIQVKVMALMGMAMTFPLFFMSESIIKLLFGESWIAASEPLKILSIMLTVQMINTALADGLTTQSLQVRRTSVQGVSVVCGIAFYVLFSNYYGIIGAAYAGVMIEVIALSGYILVTPKRFIFLRKAVAPYCFVFLMSLITLEWLFSSHPILSTLAGFSVIIGLLLIDKDLSGKIKLYLRRKAVAENN